MIEKKQGDKLKKTGVSLFSGGGFGDMGFSKSGVKHLVLAEKDPERAAFAARQFPNSRVLAIDLATEAGDVVSITRKLLRQQNVSNPHLLYATPPCQGLSKNGIGSILKSISDGKREKVDQRNRLYEPFLECASELKPTWIFFENVCRLFNFRDVDRDGAVRTLPEIIEGHLSSIGYAGSIEKVEMADYGLPQKRLRSVGIFRLKEGFSFPEKTSFIPPVKFLEHERKTLRETISHLEHLDAADNASRRSIHNHLHSVPKWRGELYNWMKHTPEGKSAFFNNECSHCSYVNENSDINCARCGSLLYKPTVLRDGKRGLIKGFVSAYKRMYWDKPASTVTTRSAYCCSDHKAHPDQNRVLSIYEVALLQGIDVEAVNWEKDGGGCYPDTLLRELIGECVPTSFTELVGAHMDQIDADLVSEREGQSWNHLAREKQMSMF